MDSSSGNVPAIPAIRIKEEPNAKGAMPSPAQTVGQEFSPPAVSGESMPANGGSRQVSGNYGHSGDYSWLQGVVDKHYQGQLYLRYCDHSVEDAWGGKVCLLDDPRLAQLKDGDVIQVEGEIIPDHDQASRGPWHHYPHYQIRDLKVVQSKN
jgi:hypothetical protein